MANDKFLTDKSYKTRLWKELVIPLTNIFQMELGGEKY